MRVFITGGMGLLGTYLTRNLQDNGHEIKIFDSYKNYLPPSDNNYSEYIERRREWIDEKNVELLRGDIRNKFEVYRAIKRTQPDRVVHLAALAIAAVCNEHPEEAVSANLDGLVNVLQAISDIDAVERFVFTSSSMIYGDFQYRPADEDHPKNPKGVYGSTKLSGEILTRAFSNQYGFDHVIIRPSAIYGPTDANRRVVQIFVERALQGKPLELHDGGTQKLDFTYVEDAAEGFSLALDHDNAINNTFNITRGEGRSLRELAGIVGNHAGGVETIETEPQSRRPTRGALDIQKARDMLGYDPEYSLEEGVEKYVRFVDEMDLIAGA